MDTEKQNKKTIAYLNSKWWYRLLKVVFVAFFLLVAAVVITVIFEEKSPEQVFDNQSSYVLCNDGRKLGLDENNVIMTSAYMYSFQEDIFKRACAYNSNSQFDFEAGLSDEEIADLEAQQYNSVDEYALSLGATITNHNDINFVLIPSYITEGGYLQVFIYSILALICVYLGFEIIRRIFYYVLLGTFVPSKN